MAYPVSTRVDNPVRDSSDFIDFLPTQSAASS